jgi:hypothetical protein
VRTAALAFGVALVVLPSPALAVETFPGAIQDYLAKTGKVPDCAVPCTVCHTREAGGTDYMKEEGWFVNLTAMPLDTADPASVGFALAALAMSPCRDGSPGNPCDSDGDGVPDVVELHEGRDPDGARAFNTCIRYGCGATIAPQRPERTGLGALSLIAALGAAAVARRARR